MGHVGLIFAGTWEFGVTEEFWGGERLSCAGFCALCESEPEEDKRVKIIAMRSRDLYYHVHRGGLLWQQRRLWRWGFQAWDLCKSSISILIKAFIYKSSKCH